MNNKLSKNEQIRLGKRLLNIMDPLLHTKENLAYSEIEGTNLISVYGNFRGGGEVIVDEYGEVLFADSSMGRDTVLEEYKKGRRTNIIHFLLCSSDEEPKKVEIIERKDKQLIKFEENKDKIIEYLNNNNKVSIDDLPGVLFNKYAHEYILDNMSKDVEELSMPLEVLKSPKLKEYKKLNKIHISSLDKYNKNDIDTIIDNSNVKEIVCLLNENVKEELKDNSIVIGNLFNDNLIYRGVFIINNMFNTSTSLYIASNNILDKLEEVLIVLKDYNHENLRIYNHKDIPVFIDMNIHPLIKYERRKEDNVLYLSIADINTIKKVVDIFTKNNYSFNSLIVELENKDYANIDEYKELDEKYNLEVQYGNWNSYRLEDFITMRDYINNYLNKIKSLDLSPLEQIVCAYDIIKEFRYDEEDEELDYSYYDICGIIKYGKIVCTGYSAFLAQLLNELGFKAYMYKLFEIPHAQTVIEVKDPKYNINGVYLFDCTWDSAEEVVKCIRENGEEELSFLRYLNPNDKIIDRGYNELISYKHFMVSGSEYEEIFKLKRPDDTNTSPMFTNYTEELNGLLERCKYSIPLTKETFVNLIRNVKEKQEYKDIDKLMNEILEFNKKRFK